MSDRASAEHRLSLVALRIGPTDGEPSEPSDGIPAGNRSPAFARE
jgi:hypothetical protein